MTEGQITILIQILIITMHIASLVKRPYLLVILRKRKYGRVKFDEISALAIPNQISLISMHTASLIKIPYLLQLSSENENMGVSQADNSEKI